MDTKKTISISEARKRIFEIADEVQSPNKVYTLTENGKPKAVIMSVEEYESLLETIDVLESCPDLGERIKEADDAVRTGNYKNFVTLDEMMLNWGFVAADKSNKKYGVRSTHNKRSPKKHK
ncbi:MAG: type II toxin-antitoxin system Phd/YefM family antitoxin [bacterium]